jgi:hypothetical protein
LEVSSVITRGISAAVIFLVAMSVFATGSINGNQGRRAIATTARIIRINSKTRTMLVRSAESPAVSGIETFIVLPEWAGTEYSVVTTSDTEFQDGADPLQFEDFKRGETISIHGVRNGRWTVTASRVAKWE